MSFIELQVQAGTDHDSDLLPILGSVPSDLLQILAPTPTKNASDGSVSETLPGMLNVLVMLHFLEMLHILGMHLILELLHILMLQHVLEINITS